MSTLYIHIPFCDRKCFYCSFVVSIAQQHRIKDYLDCLNHEAQQYQKQKIHSVYFGGGTPTLLNVEQIEQLIKIVHTHFDVEANAEITIEANPESIDEAKAKAIYSLGINRISLGVQSLNNDYLKYLGRNHNQDKAIKSYQILRDAGFNNINLDLMFGFPQQSTEEVQADVEQILQLGSEHLSLYSLTIEERSRFFVQDVQLQSNEQQADQYDLVCTLLEEAGLKQYEVSNFAQNGKESKHNLHYWHCHEYIGLGIGAHSFLNDRRFWNIDRLSEYIKRINNGQSVQEAEEQLTVEQRFKEALLFGLRMNKGISVEKIEQRFQYQLSAEDRDQIQKFISEGFLSEVDGVLKTSQKGRRVLDEICAHLI